MSAVLVLGGAVCVWEDMERALDIMEFDAVIAVKRVAAEYAGPLYAFATLHPDNIAQTMQARARNGYEPPSIIVAPRQPASGPLPNLHVTSDWGGSSGLYGVKVALESKFTHIVLAGVPMNVMPHFDRKQDWQHAPAYKNRWRKYKGEYATFTRSMSGWTREVLGEPTAAWALSGK